MPSIHCAVSASLLVLLLQPMGYISTTCEDSTYIETHTHSLENHILQYIHTHSNGKWTHASTFMLNSLTGQLNVAVNLRSVSILFVVSPRIVM